ncbi:MAG TPA: hypothetical protein DCZ92_13935 [Elusimicrobia bacterium]|nr:MAG: hypothetical protein A2016_05490 [Elusimicrobia bacterium GWF2_62_30]HBA61883.1 hypothetical protein [Elusimicrobiota bacterium]
MDDKNLFWPTVNYSLLYGLVVVPLGLFLAAMTCAGVYGLTHGFGNAGSLVLGIVLFTAVFSGSLYLAYKLGHERAMAKALENERVQSKYEAPGGRAGQA